MISKALVIALFTSFASCTEPTLYQRFSPQKYYSGREKYNNYVLGATSSSKASSSSKGSTSSSSSQQAQNFNCQSAINRFKNASQINLTSTIAAGTPFTDSQFPTSSALIWTQYPESLLNNVSSSMTWSRAKSVLTNATILGNNNNYDFGDVWQSMNFVNDNYFLAGVASLIPYPNLLNNLIVTQTYNSAGIFAANVYVRGIPQVVAIDDFLPFNKGSLYFAKQGRDASIWAALLEKVWAKVNGNYEFIDLRIWGDSFEAFDSLLGVPTKFYLTSYYSGDDEYQENFNNVFNVDTRKPTIGKSQGQEPSEKAAVYFDNDEILHVLLAATTNQQPAVAVFYDYYGDMGPAGNTYYYPIFGAYEILDFDGMVLDTVVFVGNTWGTDLNNYLSMWVDNDPNYWYPQTIAQVPYYRNSTTDGLFYVSIYEFEQYITYIEVAQVLPNYKTQIVDIRNDDGLNNGILVNVVQSGAVYIGVNYYNPRMYPDRCYNDTYGYIALFTPDGNMLAFQPTWDAMLQNYLEFDFLQAGTYYLKVVTDYGVNAVKDLTVKSYSSGNVTLRRLNQTENLRFDTVQINLALQNQGMYVEYLGETFSDYYNAYWGTGFGFSYLEVDASNKAMNMNFTIYVGNATAISNSANSRCGAIQSSATYGNFFVCTCALPAYIYEIPSNCTWDDCWMNYNPPQCNYAWSGYSLQFGTSFN